MGRFYRGTATEVIGGAGRVLTRSYDKTLFPTGVGSIIGVTDPWNAAGGWADIGFTTGGVTITRSPDVNFWSPDQIPKVLQAVSDWTHTVSFNLASATIGNLTTIWGGNGGKFGMVSKFTNLMLAVCFMDPHDVIWAWAFRKVQVSAMGDTTLNRAEMQGVPVTFACLPELDIVGTGYLFDYENVFSVFST